MFNRDYLEKLKQYVGKDIQLVESDNEVHIYLDSEIQYFLRKKEQKYILYVSERGKETEEKRYTSEVDMKRNFALWVKSNFSENIKYPFSNTECLNPVSISLPSCVIAIESVITIINIIDFFINLKYGINLFICIPPFSKMYKHILKIHSF